MAKILGIDLGTTNSAVAFIQAGQPTIIENNEGARTTPSIVGITKTGERVVGVNAKRQAVTNPKNTVYGIKRYIGHKFADAEVQKDMKNVPYELKAGTDGAAVVNMNGKDFRPEEISAMVLSKLKTDAEAKLGEKVTQAVITVPAYFNDDQRKATQDAGKIAGLEVLRIINEPTAAALAYGFNTKKDQKVVVYDFGGGTFDVSVLEVSSDTIEVKATGGDSHMGGRDIDQKLIRYVVDEFKKTTGIDVGKDPLALQRIDEAAEKAKIELSNTAETEINLPFISNGANGPEHLAVKVSRAKLNELAQEYIDASMKIVKDTLNSSPFKVTDINEVIMVGGQTRMPAIVDAVKAYFGKEPNKSVNPDEVVAIGAAIQAGILQGDVKDVLLLDVTPLSLGIETMGGVATKLIMRNTTIPTSKSQVFSTAADNQPSVEISVVQGEREMAADNKSLGRFMLDGIPPAPRGVPQVEVTFDIDANGVLKVSAKEKTTGKVQTIEIKGSSGLSKDEVEKMTKDAELHAEEDKKKKEMVEAKNFGEQIVHQAEKSLKEHGDKVPADVKKDVEEKIADLKTKLVADNIDDIKNATEALGMAMQKIGPAMAQQGGSTGSEGGAEQAEKVTDVPEQK